MKYFTGLLIGMCALCLNGWGQRSQSLHPESYGALLKSDIQAIKTDIIRQNLTLADDQAKKFWPLQRDYENDISKLGEERLDVIRDYVRNWDSMSAEMAETLGKRLLDYHKKRVDLHGRYFDRISKEISPTIAAKFFQIETQMEDMIDLEIASSLTLIK